MYLSDKCDMRTPLSILILFITWLTFIGCSHNQYEGPFYEGYRVPASGEGEGCLAMMRGLLKVTRAERNLSAEFDRVIKLLKNGEGHEEAIALTDRLQQEALKYSNEALEDQWHKLHASVTIIGQKLGRGEDISSELSSLGNIKSSYIKIRGAVRRPRVAYQNQERLEMLRSMIDEPKVKVANIPQNRREEEFISYVAFREFTNELSDSELAESQSFVQWFLKKGKFEGPSQQTLEELYHREFSRFKDSFSNLSRAERERVQKEGKERILSVYNNLSGLELTTRTSEEEFRRGSLLYLRLFSDLDPKFRNQDFLAWMFKNGELSQRKLSELLEVAGDEGFDLKLGDVLRQAYGRFASFQKLPLHKDASVIEKAKDKIKYFWEGFLKKAPECNDLDCVNKKATSMWSNAFSLKHYKDSFSCMASNPVALKTMVMDLGLIWGGIYWYYSQNEEDFQRFPYEIIANGAVFAPILAEANCRASFKSALPFGGVLPKEEVFASGAKKFARTFKYFKGIAFKGFLSSVGLLTMTAGFDHLFLAMGESIAKPLALNDMIALMPVTFLYHGAWLGLKQMAIINPLRHKLLPRVANAITKKFKSRAPFWVTQTLLDAGAFAAIAYYNEWDFLNIYHNNLYPMVMGAFTAGVSLEHKREVSPDGEVLDTYEGVTETGITSRTVIKEEEGMISLQEVDANVPQDSIEAWADAVLKDLK